MKSPFPTEGLVEEEFSRKAADFVSLVYYVLKPHTVGLFRSEGDGGEFTLTSIHSSDPNIVREGTKISFSDSFLGRTAREIGEIWIRELSPRASRGLPIYTEETRLKSIRVLPFRLDPEVNLLLVIDFDRRPDTDPIESIEPLLRLFVESAVSPPLRVDAGEKGFALPMPVFLRRILTPFVESGLNFIPIQTLGLSLWGRPASGGEIIEAVGESGDDIPAGSHNSFTLGPLSFRWSMGSPRKDLLSRGEADARTAYFPIVVRGGVVGSLSLVAAGSNEMDDSHGILVTILAWSIEKELRLIEELGMEGKRSVNSTGNPYRAVIRLLDEWSNASRYHEYLSLGLIHLELDGIDGSWQTESETKHFDKRLCSEIEDVLRKGDILIQCVNGEMALIFPRTSPEGANNALRRLGNMLEGKKLKFNGSSVRVLSADYDVLCYPADLTTEEVVLEKCGQVFHTC